MITEILEDLGLTNSEIKIYIALIELNTATAGELIEKTQITTSTLHLSLNSLIEKGLINYIYDGKRRIYQATNPDNLIDYIEGKKQKLINILPEIKKKQNQKGKKIEVATLYKGIKGIKEAYNILINEKGEEFNSFGDSLEVAEKMTYEWWANMHARRVEKELKCRQIFDERHKKDQINITLKRKLTKIRYLPKEFAQLQVTVMVGELVGISVFGENPYALLIRDKELADGYRIYFEQLWKIAKD